MTFLAISTWTDKLATSYRRGKCKKVKRLTISANFQERNLGTALSGKKIRPVGRIVKAGPVTSAWSANQIRGFRIPAHSDAWEKIIKFIIWLAPRTGKMNQIARCDCLPERARRSHLARSGLLTVSRKQHFTKSHIINLVIGSWINLLLTKFVRSR